MIVPMSRKDYENKSIEELIKDRQRIMQEIIKIENEDFYINPISTNENKPFKPKMMMSPSPETIWEVLNVDLKMITELIEEHNVDEID